jgi:hypothetical protein
VVEEEKPYRHLFPYKAPRGLKLREHASVPIGRVSEHLSIYGPPLADGTNEASS